MPTEAESASRFVARQAASIPTTGSGICVPQKKADVGVAPSASV
jgi:hypothetical protein